MSRLHHYPLRVIQPNLEKREQEYLTELREVPTIATKPCPDEGSLAIIGVALTMAQLITPKVAERLLILMAIPKAGADYDTLLLLAVQFGVTLLFAILTYIGITIARKFA